VLKGMSPLLKSFYDPILKGEWNSKGQKVGLLGTDPNIDRRQGWGRWVEIPPCRNQPGNQGLTGLRTSLWAREKYGPWLWTKRRERDGHHIKALFRRKMEKRSQDVQLQTRCPARQSVQREGGKQGNGIWLFETEFQVSGAWAINSQKPEAMNHRQQWWGTSQGVFLKGGPSRKACSLNSRLKNEKQKNSDFSRGSPRGGTNIAEEKEKKKGVSRLRHRKARQKNAQDGGRSGGTVDKRHRGALASQADTTQTRNHYGFGRSGKNERETYLGLGKTNMTRGKKGIRERAHFIGTAIRTRHPKYWRAALAGGRII